MIVPKSKFFLNRLRSLFVEKEHLLDGQAEEFRDVIN